MRIIRTKNYEDMSRKAASIYTLICCSALRSRCL